MDLIERQTSGIQVLIGQDPADDGIVNWQPLYDLYTTGDEVIINIELAGVAAHDMSIFLNKDRLQIIGLRKPAPPLKPDCCTFHTAEIPYGRFSQRIAFPLPVHTAEYRIDHRDGMLIIRISFIKETVIPIED